MHPVYSILQVNPYTNTSGIDEGFCDPSEALDVH